MSDWAVWHIRFGTKSISFSYLIFQISIQRVVFYKEVGFDLERKIKKKNGIFKINIRLTHSYCFLYIS